jgi:hypothetical protein
LEQKRSADAKLLVGKVQISAELFLAAADNCFVGEFLSLSSWDFAICDF